ncbi:MAG TPA: hypothetical protein VKR79_05660 [Gaiellaceae bacterium]|nr:hypothetical protein [Gaiellaceae bacterium]
MAALVGAPSAVPAASAASPSAQCLVKNGTTRYTNLATAISAAATNATLSISGTCGGQFTIARNLTLNGLGPVAILDPGGGGNGQGTGTVLTVEEARVVVKGLTITGGQRGVDNENGNLTLSLCTVTDNSGGGGGGGVYNHHGNLNLVGTNVFANESNGGGGGIFNYQGTVTLSGNSAVDGNEAPYGTGGGIDNDGGTVTLNDGSSVDGNDAYFGGAFENFFGTLTLNGHSSIEGNSAEVGGGVRNVYATLALNGQGVIAYNEPGSGIDDTCGTLIGVVVGVNVFDNSPYDTIEEGCGGGP